MSKKKTRNKLAPMNKNTAPTQIRKQKIRANIQVQPQNKSKNKQTIAIKPKATHYPT